MTLNECQQLAARTLNSGLSSNASLAMCCMGLAGETGEVVDLIKKHLFHQHQIDEEKLKKEIGDVLWYIAGLATTCQFSLDEIAQMNIAKLRKRYPDGFSAEASRMRID